jgi:hypothetical protein
VNPVRWKFWDPKDAAESKARDAVVARMDAWWEAFAARREDLSALFSREKDWDLPRWMMDHLHSIDERLMWEYGPALKGKGHRLVITPESERHLRPLVETLLERAPSLPGWEFYPYRPAEEVEVARSAVQARAGGDLPEKAVVAAGEHRTVDVTYFFKKHGRKSESVAFVVTETLVGEETLDRWVGGIRAAPLSDAPRKGALPLGRLRAAIEAGVQESRDGLPDAPQHQVDIEEAEYSLCKLQPKERETYPGRSDLLTLNTRCLDIMLAAHSPGVFDSARFSRFGELFCYVKIDGTDGLEGSAFSDRADIEDALQKALAPSGLGAVIGGGTGLRYSYIDLALASPARGAGVVRRVLREGRVPRASWLLFFDDTLAREWVGIHDDAPDFPTE